MATAIPLSADLPVLSAVLSRMPATRSRLTGPRELPCSTRNLREAQRMPQRPNRPNLPAQNFRSAPIPSAQTLKWMEVLSVVRLQQWIFRRASTQSSSRSRGTKTGHAKLKRRQAQSTSPHPWKNSSSPVARLPSAWLFYSSRHDLRPANSPTDRFYRLQKSSVRGELRAVISGFSLWRGRSSPRPRRPLALRRSEDLAVEATS